MGATASVPMSVRWRSGLFLPRPLASSAPSKPSPSTRIQSRASGSSAARITTPDAISRSPKSRINLHGPRGRPHGRQRSERKAQRGRGRFQTTQARTQLVLSSRSIGLTRFESRERSSRRPAAMTIGCARGAPEAAAHRARTLFVC